MILKVIKCIELTRLNSIKRKRAVLRKYCRHVNFSDHTWKFKLFKVWQKLPKKEEIFIRIFLSVLAFDWNDCRNIIVSIVDRFGGIEGITNRRRE